MNERMRRLAVPGLRWCVGLIVLWQSWRFMVSTEAGREFAGTGLPSWIRLALGGTELMAAILFLVPVAMVVGGYALLVVFFFATVLHILHGWYDVSALVLYAMAVLVSLAHREDRIREDHRGVTI
jgi:hypothetical protein